jgi:hypothetical protein
VVTNVSKEHAAIIFRVEATRAGKWNYYTGRRARKWICFSVTVYYSSEIPYTNKLTTPARVMDSSATNTKHTECPVLTVT